MEKDCSISSPFPVPLSQHITIYLLTNLTKYSEEIVNLIKNYI